MIVGFQIADIIPAGVVKNAMNLIEKYRREKIAEYDRSEAQKIASIK